MKALCLITSAGRSVCAVNSTITITNKEGNLRLTFGGCAKENPDIYYSWYSAELKAGDNYTIKYKDFDASSFSQAEDIVDYGNHEEIQKRMLEHYHRLKNELAAGGINID